MFSFIKNIFKGTLHKACEKGNIEAVKQFLADGADVNGKDDSYGGGTPLHMATIQDRKEVAELLIAKGSDVNAKNEEGYTPLHYAASNGHKEVTELLIAKGADVNAKIADGWTALDEVTHPDNPNASAETAELLRKHGAKTGDELEAEDK